jgi:putative addiction module component (TIGR02574 family)
MSELIEVIKKLSVEERIELIQTILRTISAEAAFLPDFDISKETMEEVRRREAEILDGKVNTVSWNEIRGKLAERYGV